MPRSISCQGVFDRRARIGSAHERLWNFLPASQRAGIAVAFLSLPSSIKAGTNEVKKKKAARSSRRNSFFALAMPRTIVFPARRTCRATFRLARRISKARGQELFALLQRPAATAL
jgi:hypothetical protein